ncbi:MAG: Na(+)-translocating NADH-quinone reductase subunit A [Bacteroidales bacterium]|jgi:Na+-transporting NADH:ubiquinone oxidoreductase subunit A|nr:Na(+)-translocating NADH-quinone reductase subunit A [Bacteroidales bacterium]
MLKVIKIRKGLDIALFGAAKPQITDLKADCYALKPKDYVGITPKMMVEEGDSVMIGSPVFFAKEKPEVKFVSPVAGVVKSIMRGEKRALEAIVIEAKGEDEYVDFGKADAKAASREQIVEKLLASGCWTLIRQRPYSVIPNPAASPKAIIIKGFDTAPLAADYALLMSDCGTAFQTGIDAISKLTDGKVHLNIGKTSSADCLLKAQNVQINVFEGKHPTGNISIQIEKLCPLNKDERIWYLDATDVVTIGRLFEDGVFKSDKIIALTGEQVIETGYYRIKRGSSLAQIFKDNVKSEDNRFISGNVLTGTRIAADGFLSAYDNMVSVIREGNQYEFIGWMLPGFKKFSISRTFPYGFLRFFCRKPVSIDANLHGGRRAFVFTGEFEKVLPLDIYPLELIKACITEDIDKMEQLGIYETDSEDFALCEVIDVSKTDIQQIIKQGLDLMRKELGE